MLMIAFFVLYRVGCNRSVFKGGTEMCSVLCFPAFRMTAAGTDAAGVECTKKLAFCVFCPILCQSISVLSNVSAVLCLYAACGAYC